MRIVHVIWSGKIGGAERSVFVLASAQQRRGETVEVLFASNPQGFFAEKLIKEGLRVRALEMRSSFDLVRGFLRSRELLDQCSIFHFHSAEPALFFLLCRRPGNRFVYTHRSGLFSYPIKQKIRYFFWGILLRFFFQAVTGISPAAKLALQKNLHYRRNNISLIPNAIEPTHFQVTESKYSVKGEIGIAEDTFVLLTAAHIRKCKRLELLLEAIAELANNRVVAVIVGDGPDSTFYKRFAHDKGIDGRVYFLGFKTNIANYLQIADVFVMTSGKEEGFGNAPVEAMAMGIPTVLYWDLTSLVPYFEIDKHVSVVSAQRKLSDLILSLMNDPSRLQTLSKEGREAVLDRFAISNVVVPYSKIYQSIISCSQSK